MTAGGTQEFLFGDKRLRGGGRGMGRVSCFVCFYGIGGRCAWQVLAAGGEVSVGGDLLVDIFTALTVVVSLGTLTRRGTANGTCGTVRGSRGMVGGSLRGGTVGRTHGRTGRLAGRKFGAPMKGLPLSGRLRGS